MKNIDLKKILKPEFHWILGEIREGTLLEAENEFSQTGTVSRPVLTMIQTGPDRQPGENRSKVYWGRVKTTPPPAARFKTLDGWYPIYILIDLDSPDFEASTLHEIGHIINGLRKNMDPALKNDYRESRAGALAKAKDEIEAWRIAAGILAVPENFPEMENSYIDSVLCYAMNFVSLAILKTARLKKLVPLYPAWAARPIDKTLKV